MLSGLDYGIIAGYFVLIVVAGLWVSRKASDSIDEYFLGGRSIPWFILGISGVATYVDMSGTMVQSSFFYMLGAKGYWVCYRGAICLPLAFLMIFMGKWHRRSRAMTNPGLLRLRFGNDTQGQLSQFLSTVSILFLAVAFMAYFFIGAGKFLHEYMPNISENVCALILFGIILIYAVASGFYGVVYTDVIQAALILAVIAFVTVKALSVGTADYFASRVGENWRHFNIPWELDMSSLPANYENMKFFALLLLFWTLSNVFIGFAMPIDAWSSQRYYAAKDERESSLVAFQWIILFMFRFFLMMAIGVLALGISDRFTDPEQALPAVITAYIPMGVKGLFIAALIAAAMSTIDSTLNSCAAYFVKDVYQKYIKPQAGRKHLVYVSYLTTIALMALGVLVGWQGKTIDKIWGWIMMSLFTGVLVPNILKWFWWRFNGAGYAGGMIFGLLGATIQYYALPHIPEYLSFSLIFGLSVVGSVLGVYCGKPTDMSILVEFYTRIKPFGFWGPVRKQLDPEFVRAVHKENGRDLLLLIPATLFQLILFYVPVAVVIKRWDSVAWGTAALVVLGIILYKFWYTRLEKGDQDKTSI